MSSLWCNCFRIVLQWGNFWKGTFHWLLNFMGECGNNKAKISYIIIYYLLFTYTLSIHLFFCFCLCVITRSKNMFLHFNLFYFEHPIWLTTSHTQNCNQHNPLQKNRSRKAFLFIRKLPEYWTQALQLCSLAGKKWPLFDFFYSLKAHMLIGSGGCPFPRGDRDEMMQQVDSITCDSIVCLQEWPGDSRWYGSLWWMTNLSVAVLA